MDLAQQNTEGEIVAPDSHRGYAADPLSFVIKATDFCLQFEEMADKSSSAQIKSFKRDRQIGTALLWIFSGSFYISGGHFSC